jgi:hypothetical protein
MDRRLGSKHVKRLFMSSVWGNGNQNHKMPLHTRQAATSAERMRLEEMGMVLPSGE